MDLAVATDVVVTAFLLVRLLTVTAIIPFFVFDGYVMIFGSGECHSCMTCFAEQS